MAIAATITMSRSLAVMCNLDRVEGLEAPPPKPPKSPKVKTTDTQAHSHTPPLYHHPSFPHTPHNTHPNPPTS